jgi:16S rRNA (guanine527-N7)-methyltransferase
VSSFASADDERRLVRSPAPPDRAREHVSETALEAFFGGSWDDVRHFHALLLEHGERRGLIGPREAPRLWTRHVLNSAALAPFMPATGAVADIGTGAGLPGVVLALMRPDLALHLVEPMQRRIDWLTEVVATLAVTNVTLHPVRAEELRGSLQVDAATARAVAPLGTLATWSLPLVRPGGRLVVLKGRQAQAEVATARSQLRRLGVADVRLHEADPLDLGEPTTVVEILKR